MFFLPLYRSATYHEHTYLLINKLLVLKKITRLFGKPYDVMAENEALHKAMKKRIYKPGVNRSPFSSE